MNQGRSANIVIEMTKLAAYSSAKISYDFRLIWNFSFISPYRLLSSLLNSVTLHEDYASLRMWGCKEKGGDKMSIEKHIAMLSVKCAV